MDDESVPVQVRLEVPVLGALAQLGERLPCTQEVRGSSPLGSTKLYISYCCQTKNYRLFLGLKW